MKNAKELAEELNFSYFDDRNNSIKGLQAIVWKSKDIKYEGSRLEIIFDMTNKRVETYMCNNQGLTKFRCILNLKLIAAMQKQIEELGWE